MIGAEYLVMDLAIEDLVHESLADHVIVDAPACIVFSSVEAVAPPGVFDLVFMKEAECIDIAMAKKIAEPRPLFVGEAGVVAVGIRVLDIDLFVGDVQIAGIDDGFLLVKLI